MAAYISVPRDFSKVKSKVAFNLTARQLICFGAAAVVGVPLFFVLRDTAGNSGATLGMMAVMLPIIDIIFLTVFVSINLWAILTKNYSNSFLAGIAGMCLVTAILYLRKGKK